MSDYKIGDEVYIHGYVDEIRKDTVIIRNKGGYFGTVYEEIMPYAQPTTESEEEFEEDETWAIVFRGKDTRAVIYGCPVCGEAYMKKDTCPNCGAEMREETDAV